MKQREQSELEIKMKNFEHAFANGELDHLHENMPAMFRLKKQLHRLADNSLQHDSTYDSELRDFQSVIGMVHTLTYEGRVHELYNILKEHYPEYYTVQG